MNDDNLFEGWDENPADLDFFGETEKEEPKKDSEKKDSEKKESKEKSEEKIIENNLFKEEKEEEVEKKEPIIEEKDYSVSTLEYLKEKGLVDFELEKDAELNSELAEEILEDSLDKRIEERVNELFEDLPNEVKELNKFVIDGGNINDFLNAYSKNKDVNTDLTKEENQELMVKNHLKKEGYDDDYIKSQIEFLKDSNNLEKIANTYLNKYKKEKEKEKETILKEQKNKSILEKENRRKLKNKVVDYIKDKENINGLTLSKSDKRVLPSYMTDKKIKLKNGETISEMQKDLYMALQDEKKSIIISKLLKNDFNFKEIEINAETKVTKQIKDDIRRNKETTPSKSTNTSYQKTKRLSDYF